MRKATRAITAGGLLLGIGLWWIARPALEPPAPAPPAGEAPSAPAPGRISTHVGTTPVPGPELPLPRVEIGKRGPDPSRVPTPSASALVGRVVDERRRPVAGAVVSLFLPESLPLTARTGPDGGWRFDVAPPASGAAGLVARDGRGRAATAHVGGRIRSRYWSDSPVLTLRPAVALAVRVTSGGVPVPDAVVLVGQFVPEIPVGACRTSPDGTALVADLLPGEVRVRAYDGMLQQAEAFARVPRDGDEPLVLELVPGRSLAVQVIRSRAGDGIPGVRIEVRRAGSANPFYPPTAIAPTDEAGRTRIDGLPPGERLDLMAFAGDGIPLGGTPVKGDATEARIEVPAGRTVRWPLVAADAPVPVEGTVLAVRQAPGPRTFALPSIEARVAGRDAILHGLPPNDAGGAGGHVVVSGLPPVDLELVATAPDGALARLAIGAREDAGTPVRFLLPRALDVIVRDEAGAAEAGVPVVLRKDRVFMTEERTTGADGRARFEGLSRDVIEAWAPEAGPDGRGLALGTADLGPGDGLVLAVLPVARDLLVRVRIDGKPGLPGRFELRAEGLVPGPLVEDPGAGELRGRVRQARPGTSLPIRLERTGFLAEGSRAEPRDAAGTLVGEIGLRSPGALLVRVLTPSGGGGFSLQLEQPDGTGGWRPAVGPGLPNGPVSGTGALVRMSPLDTGTYRVLDCLSACPSDPVWVQAGASPAEVTLDLRRVGWIGGRVVVPEGATVAGARVIVEGRIPGWTGVPALPEGQPVQPDGTFRVRVARFPVSLRASHPLFRSRGAVSVGEPRKDIELRLDAGPTLRFRTAPPLPDDAAPKVRVLVFRGGLDGPPSSEHTTRFQDGALRCGGFAPGRATLWIDAPDRAPAVVRGVELGEDDTDLGEVALPAGTALQVRLLAGAGGSPPQEAAICLIARTGPVYSRCGRSWKGEPEVTVRALQPGPFLLRASLAVDGQPRLVDREIIVEAGPDPTIVLDPR